MPNSAQSNHSDPEIIEIDGDEYRRIAEGVNGKKGRPENRISTGIRLKDEKEVVLRYVPNDITSRRLALLNTAIRVRQTLNGTLDSRSVPEFLCGERQSNQWCATTLIPGKTLKEINEAKRLATRFIPSRVRIQTTCADTIGVLKTTNAWPTNLIHRDLKPANIVKTPDDRYAIIDWEFGTTLGELAKAKSAEEKVSALGTPRYMAPEVADHAEWIPESDDFAIVMMAAEALGLLHIDTAEERTTLVERTNLVEKANGVYRKRLLEQLKQFEERARAEATKGKQSFDDTLWGRLQTWLILGSSLKPQKRPKRRDILSYLTNPGNIQEI